VIALLGGFTVTILSFILPSYLHLQIVGYQNITSGKGKSGLGDSEISYSVQERANIVRTDIYLTVAGTLLCVIATGVTTIGFLSRVSNGGNCM
jgi:hypothetical protein